MTNRPLGISPYWRKCTGTLGASFTVGMGFEGVILFDATLLLGNLCCGHPFAIYFKGLPSKYNNKHHFLSSCCPYLNAVLFTSNKFDKIGIYF
jgi:hypothetical protein